MGNAVAVMVPMRPRYPRTRDDISSFAFMVASKSSSLFQNWCYGGSAGPLYSKSFRCQSDKSDMLPYWFQTYSIHWTFTIACILFNFTHCTWKTVHSLICTSYLKEVRGMCENTYLPESNQGFCTKELHSSETALFFDQFNFCVSSKMHGSLTLHNSRQRQHFLKKRNIM